ncbi:MAG: gluconokinase [Bacteroidetes bacterium]|nr:gluconokinase [Bacteroidota bacterium]
MDYIIGIDIGTTSTKALAFNLEGKLLSKSVKEYPLITPQPHYCEQDPQLIFESAIEVLKNTVNENKNHQLLALSFSSAMHSLIAVDKKGEPLTNCIIWADNGADQQAKQLKSQNTGKIIYERTGTPLHAMTPLCKLAWFYKNDPQLLRHTHKFIGIKEYVIYRLVGKFLIDYSLASATGLFDNQKLTWLDQSLEFAHVSSSQLSKLVSPLHTEVGLNKKWAKALGISTDVPVVMGASDGCLANLGSYAFQPGEAVVTIGTSGAIRVGSTRPLIDPQQRLFCYLLQPGHYISGGAVNNGGIVLDWFAKNMVEGDIPIEKLLNDAAKITPGSDGLIFLPYLLGERAPIWDSQASGGYMGISIEHKQAHFLRAALEGVIFNIYQIGRALKEVSGEIHLIKANGGFAQSKLWLQILADVFNRKVYYSDIVDAPSVGAFLMALEALKISDWKEVHTNNKEEELIVPNPVVHKTYQKSYSIFEGLYPNLKQDFAKIYQLKK